MQQVVVWISVHDPWGPWIAYRKLKTWPIRNSNQQQKTGYRVRRRRSQVVEMPLAGQDGHGESVKGYEKTASKRKVVRRVEKGIGAQVEMRRSTGGTLWRK